MRGSGDTTILTFFGNDDLHPLEPMLDDLAAKGLAGQRGGGFYGGGDAQGRPEGSGR